MGYTGGGAKEDGNMTTVQLELPDQLANSIRAQGQLHSDGRCEMLQDALRAKANVFIDDVAERIKRAGVPPMSDDEIQAEIDAMRAERKRP
jgi:hypothetical protein